MLPHQLLIVFSPFQALAPPPWARHARTWCASTRAGGRRRTSTPASAPTWSTPTWAWMRTAGSSWIKVGERCAACHDLEEEKLIN